MTPLRIAIVAHGRFHAFDLARTMIARGHDVRLYTNYPAAAVEAFGVPAANVESFVWHGIAGRLARVAGAWATASGEPVLHRLFGRWAARRLAKRSWDVIHCWSGVSEELLASPSIDRRLTLLMRGSTHIDVQSRLLANEEDRVGRVLDRPSVWMRERERREYLAADAIVVLSSFARTSFVTEGTAGSRLLILPLGVDVEAFRATSVAIAARRLRIESGAPLRVLYTGAVSYRKGFFDLAAAMRHLKDEAIEFTLVGEILPEVQSLLEDLRQTGCRVVARGKVPQAQLPKVYADADVFAFPTIEDGFAMVLAQALAAGLPTIATTNCAGPDLVENDRNGSIIPATDSAALVEHLRACVANRSALAAMASRIPTEFVPRDWTDVARDFEAMCLARTEAHSTGRGTVGR